MAGDRSDSYNGIPGIGDVYARKLLASLGGLDSIFAAAQVRFRGKSRHMSSVCLKGCMGRASLAACGSWEVSCCPTFCALCAR